MGELGVGRRAAQHARQGGDRARHPVLEGRRVPRAQKGDDRPPDDERAVIRETEAALAADDGRGREAETRGGRRSSAPSRLRRFDTGDYGKGAPSREKIVQARIARSGRPPRGAGSGALSRWFSASFGRVFTGGQEADAAPASG